MVSDITANSARWVLAADVARGGNNTLLTSVIMEEPLNAVRSRLPSSSFTRSAVMVNPQQQLGVSDFKGRHRPFSHR
jgi:hypothetical protein